MKKHPDSAPLSPNYCLLDETPPMEHDPHSVWFEKLDGVLIRSMIMRMDGAADPLGLDVSGWKKMCLSFGRESDDLGSKHCKKAMQVLCGSGGGRSPVG